MVTFVHTADWQLGKPFGTIPDPDKRARAKRARLEAVEAMAEVVRAHGAEFVVVAGDLFDMEQPSASLMHEACRAVRALEVPVFVIPGNHDSGAPGSVWGRDDFERIRREVAPNLEVMLEPRPVRAPGGAVLLPCPLTRRHTVSDPGAWIGPEALEGAPEDAPVIAVAHGSVQAFTDAETHTNQLELEEWREAAHIDYVALGDWHGTKRIDERAWYSGTPEQDRFRGEGYDAGNVLVVTIAERGAPPEVKKVRTGRLAWRALQPREILDEETLEALMNEVNEALSDTGDDVLRLEVRGSLGLDAAQRLREFLDDLEARVTHLERSEEILEAPTEADFARLASGSEPVVAAVSRRLREEHEAGGDEAEMSRHALRILFEAHRRASALEGGES